MVGNILVEIYREQLLINILFLISTYWKEELEKKAIKARNLAVRQANEVKNVRNIKKLPTFSSTGKGTSKKSKHAKKPKSSKNPKLYKKKAKSSSKKK